MTKEDWRGFSQNLAHTANIGDTVVAVPGYMQIPLQYYYNNQTDVTVQLGASSVAELQNITSDRRILYVVTSDVYAQDPTGDMWNWLKLNTKYVGQHAGISLFVKESPI